MELSTTQYVPGVVRCPNDLFPYLDFRSNPTWKELQALRHKLLGTPRGDALRSAVDELARYFRSDPAKHPVLVRVKGIPLIGGLVGTRGVRVHSRWEGHHRASSLDLDPGDVLGKWTFVWPFPERSEVAFLSSCGLEVFEGFHPAFYECVMRDSEPSSYE